MKDCQERELLIEFPFVKAGESYLLTDEDSGESIEIKEGTVSLLFETKRQARLLWVKKL
jgi:hypothetical protein